jgi:hypothetical protein
MTPGRCLAYGGRSGLRWTYSSKADFIAKEMEATDASLSIVEVVVLDEAKAVEGQRSQLNINRQAYPLHKPVFRSIMDLEL